MPFIPHTEADIQAMLATIGADTIDDLFDEIPASLRAKPFANIPAGLTELEATQLMQARAKRVDAGLSFLGAGAYEHHIPAAVWELVGRGEFLTAYTPYQAEASQGNLQILYEYQTMMASLTGLDCSNASLYDGATALAEAVLMAVRCNRRSKTRRILVPESLHPHYRDTVQSIVKLQEIELVPLACELDTGKVDQAQLEELGDSDITALIIPQPNFFGVCDDVDALTNWAHQHNAFVIACVNPTAMALLKEPGAWGEQGADIACGEAQPLGVPLASGGPYAGFITCKNAYIRQLPGRIAGRTLDSEGKPGFTLTLQAREQHIRRSKATSNICTNQGLLVTAVTIYLTILGFDGLQRVAKQCHHNLHALLQRLTALPGVSLAHSSKHFHEAVVVLPKPAADVIAKLTEKHIHAGLDLQPYYPQYPNALLICVTETKTSDDLDRFAQALAEELAA